MWLDLARLNDLPLEELKVNLLATFIISQNPFAMEHNIITGTISHYMHNSRD